MNMKKTIILLGLLLVMNYTAFAEQRGIFMDFHGDINPKKDMEVNRTPMKLPIEVILLVEQILLETFLKKRKVT